MKSAVGCEFYLVRRNEQILIFSDHFCTLSYGAMNKGDPLQWNCRGQLEKDRKGLRGETESGLEGRKQWT